MRIIPVPPNSAEDGQFVASHRKTGTAEYQAWANAIYRCENPNAEQWKRYGGRGIAVDLSWRMNFDRFLADMGERPSSDHSLERKNVDGDYTASNCRWATAFEQAQNRRNTAKAAGMTLREVAEAAGLPINTVRKRFHRGWSADRILSQPKRDYPVESMAC